MEWEEKAGELLAHLEQVFTSTKDFAVEQAPLVVQEFFMWYTVHHLFWTGFGVLLVLLAVYVHKVGKDSNKSRFGQDMYMHTDGGWAIVVAIPLTAGCIVTLTNVYYSLQLLVAPRIFLLEKIGTFFN